MRRKVWRCGEAWREVSGECGECKRSVGGGIGRCGRGAGSVGGGVEPVGKH